MSNFCVNPISLKSSIPFKGNEEANPLEHNTKWNEMQQQRELASKECAYATRATAMAQILTGNNLKYTTTPKEYVDGLIKQGKIPNKHFYIQDENMYEEPCKFASVVELNSDGERIKETCFCRDNKYSGSWVSQRFFNPKYDQEYKCVTYQKDGGISIQNYNTIGECLMDSYVYRADGSLEYYENYVTDEGVHLSKGRKETYYDLKDAEGNRVKRGYDDYGNLLYELK